MSNKIGIYEAHVHVTAPDGTDYRYMRYAYDRKAIRAFGARQIKANKDTINTVTVEYRER